LRELSDRFDCKVYAYCLLVNHVHLLVGVGEDTSSPGRLMKHLAGRHSRYINSRDHRSGALWEGRFRSSPVAPDFVAPTMRYIELHPVRACLAQRAEEYAWSSCANRTGVSPVDLRLEPCAPLHELSDSPALHRRSHVEYLYSAVPEDEWHCIRRGVMDGVVTGTREFGEALRAQYSVDIERRSPGRPRVCV
jgi:putative transposase